MALRVALVTPFAWSQPHDVNEHVAGLARELRARGHSVTVLAPSNRARDLAAGRRALATGLEADFVALGPADDLQPDDPDPATTLALGPLLVEPRWGRVGAGIVRVLAARYAGLGAFPRYQARS